jgi:DNA polymerase elongation subunit (family B)
VYIPHNRISAFFSNITALFKTLFYYDVNSLYPTVMANHEMPIGKPIAFEGNIRNVDPNAYGFFYCKITSPEYLEHPILQRRLNTSEGMRTIAGLGSWEGWISSIEMDNAVKFGYTFEILKGYQFEKGFIFKEYVNKMYELRKEYSKDHAMNLIAKLLMNSLYGKFGMKLEQTELAIYDTSTEAGKEFFYEMIESWGETIQDFIKFDNKFLIIRNTLMSYKYDEELDMYHGVDVNIAIASAITAGARVNMSIFKNNPDYKLYYSDTDSIVIDQPLPEEFVGTNLGQLKLEHTIDRAVFLAPKVYGLVDTDGQEIIKVKGVTHELATELHINDLEQLLVKDSSKEFNQEKWFKKVIEGTISISDVAYTLKVTSNKIALFYT